MVIRTLFFVVFWIFISALTFCQVSDDFTDGEIHTNPVWSGDTSLFWVVDPGNSGDGSLAAGANDDGKVLCSKPNINDAVITTISTISEGEWIFSVADGAGWALSGTNDYNIILMSDENDVSKLTDGSFDFNGYFLHRGCSSCDDVFELYRQDGTNSTLIINTNYPAFPDGTGSETGHTVKITRDNNGFWDIYIDEGFDTVPQTLKGGPVVDTTYSTSSYFAISTNIANASDKRVLYFDNLSINNTGSNLLPPSGLSINYIAPDKINLIWTKPGGTYGMDWDGVIVFACEGNPNDADMNNTDAVDYSSNLQYGGGTQNNNSFCVVNQNNNSDGDVIITGLSNGLNYFFIAYAYSEIAGNDNDDWSIATAEVDDTSLVQGISGFCSYAGEAMALLTWTNYTVIPGTWWDEVMIVGRLGTAVDQSPFGDGSNYLANPNFGLGTEIGGTGTGNYVVYKGIEDSVVVSDLIDDSIYYFRAFVRYDSTWTGVSQYKDTTAIPSSEKIFISEVADPLNNYNARFLEIYNAGTDVVDLNNKNWYLCKQTNGGNWGDLLLTGKIHPGCTYVISYNIPDFVSSYFFQAEQASTIVSGNGNDGYFLYKNGDHLSGRLVDSYGHIDQDGSGTLWEYTDSRVIRKDTVISANSIWNSDEWIIYSQAATGDMDPGRYRSGIQWQGIVSGNWNDGSNWTGGNIPDTATSVVLHEATNYIPEVTGSSVCYDLRIDPLGRLDIKSGGSLNVSNDIIIKADHAGTGSILTEGISALHYGGQIIIERYFSSNEKWHYISSPLSDCNADVFIGGLLNSWNETSQIWEHIVDPGDSLNITEGYSVNLPLSFGSKANFITTSGILNTGSYNSKPLTYTYGQDSTLNGFNFIGNPYPSSIDWDLVNIPTSIDAAVYYWDPSSGTQGMYKSYVPGVGGSGSRYIPSMHGFFVHASDTINGAVINFDNSVRTHDGQMINYKNGNYKDLLKFVVCGNNFCDATYLYFTTLASEGFDGSYDAYKLFTIDTLVPQIFSRISNADLSVNSMPLPQKGVIIPLGFKSGSPGVFTLSLDQLSIFNPLNNIVLKDLQTGFAKDLTKNNNYSFSYQTGDDQNRFLLYINYILTDKPVTSGSTGISIRAEKNKILVNCNGEDGEMIIEIMNLLGQRLAKYKSTKYATNIFDMQGKSGLYLIKVICENEIIIQKVLLR